AAGFRGHHRYHRPILSIHGSVGAISVYATASIEGVALVLDIEVTRSLARGRNGERTISQCAACGVASDGAIAALSRWVAPTKLYTAATTHSVSSRPTVMP